MLKEIATFFNSSQATALVAFFVTVIVAGFKLVKPYIQHKIDTEKNVHTKQALELGLSFANVIVPEMAVMQGLSKSDRKKEGIRFVNNQLKKNGWDLDFQTISGLVEKAYQAYKLTGADNHTPIPSPAADDTPTVQATPTSDGAKVTATPSSTAKQGDQDAK